MSLFNPYAFTPFGQPAAPTVSALRAIGVPASAAQLYAAQSVFRTFCAQTQLSAAPNQTAIGRLPDGTQYKIAVAGAMATMTVWPTANKKGRSLEPGIGVTTAGGCWILRPPGKELKPESGKWSVKKVKSVSGGAVYVFTADDYFVEATTGLSQNNSRVADSIHGADGSRYVAASNAFSVSNPFLAGGAVKQLKISGDTLELGARDLEDGVPGATLSTSTHDLPGVSAGDQWGMVSSNATGKLIAVCRLEDDPDTPDEGSISLRVCAVAHMKAGPPPKEVARPPNTLVEVTSVQSLAPVVVERAPKAAAGEAPVMSEWARSKEEGYSEYIVTLANPNPYAPNPTYEVDGYDIRDKEGYEEKARFESRSTYRAYIGSDGNLITDTLKRIDVATIVWAEDRSYRGYDLDTNIDWVAKHNSSLEVRVERNEEVSFGGTRAVKLYSMKIEYDRTYDGDRSAKTYFVRLAYNDHGNIVGFIDGADVRGASLWTAKGNIERSAETLLVVDDQFGVVVTAKVVLGLVHTLRYGEPGMSASHAGDPSRAFDRLAEYVGNRGMYPGTPVDETLTTTRADISLEVLHGTSRTFTKLAPPERLAELAEKALNELLGEVRASAGRAVTPKDDPEATEGVRMNRFQWEQQLSWLIEDVFSMQLGDVMYAKDPKTGAGFLSFTWAEKPQNYVVGPWGVAPSESRTTIAKGATISALQSV